VNLSSSVSESTIRIGQAWLIKLYQTTMSALWSPLPPGLPDMPLFHLLTAAESLARQRENLRVPLCDKTEFAEGLMEERMANRLLLGPSRPLHALLISRLAESFVRCPSPSYIHLQLPYLRLPLSSCPAMISTSPSSIRDRSLTVRTWHSSRRMNCTSPR
jgi:hypothetical protein